LHKKDELLNAAMLMLAEQPNAIFLGQNVEYDGNVVFKHLEGVPDDMRIEMPVAEELQTGIAIGLSLQGFLPISIYPRMDFLLRAADQIVNHLDKLNLISNSQWNPKVILRTKVGATKPLNAGPQHTQDHTVAFQAMCKTIRVVPIRDPEQILTTYEQAIEREGSTLIVEILD
jgi:2-oxoisovalerate dehydrogenase E1 component beta subunit